MAVRAAGIRHSPWGTVGLVLSGECQGKSGKRPDGTTPSFTTVRLQDGRTAPLRTLVEDKRGGGK